MIIDEKSLQIFGDVENNEELQQLILDGEISVDEIVQACQAIMFCGTSLYYPSPKILVFRYKYCSGFYSTIDGSYEPGTIISRSDLMAFLVSFALRYGNPNGHLVWSSYNRLKEVAE